MPEAQRPVEGQLLLFPYADAEGLLGREVQLSDRGGYRIAEARAPGCEVIVRRTKAQFHSVRETRTSQLASIGAGYQQLLSLEAKYGRESQASLDLSNTEVLEADLRGPCGKKVVSKLFVGRGKRRLFAASEASGGARVATAAGDVTPKASSNARAVDELAWDDDQAYAFDVRDLETNDAAQLAVDVSVPSIVNEGEEVHVTFTSPREAWLVVYYVDGENKAEVLWPSNEEPAPHVLPGTSAHLPSPNELAAGIHLRPALSKPGVRAREKLIVYAFADKRDFDLAKPPSGASSADGVTFADELVKKLRDVPASRWSRTVLGYTIEPKH